VCASVSIYMPQRCRYDVMKLVISYVMKPDATFCVIR
jgi:hypothetical protein